MAIQSDDKLTKLFAEYLKDKKILVADTNATSRTSIAAGLVSLGAIQANIDLATNYRTANEIIKENKNEVIICDYNLGSESGLDLIQTQRENCEEMKKSLFILVTGDASQSAVAQAAEEDVDTFILKPFSSLTLRKCILNAAKEKLFPNDYKKKIQEGKELMLEEKFNGAAKRFKEAMELDPNPTLACFYHGQARMLKDFFDDAQQSYQKGLSFNKIHYKCLVGLYELLLKNKQYEDAYDVVKKISRTFPANPNRLSMVVRLAIMTENYADIEKYYANFVEISKRNQNLTKYICAGLVVCGKYYIQKKNAPRALDLFKKATITGYSIPHIHKEILITLIQNEYHEKAHDFLERFPGKDENTDEYKAMCFLVESSNMDSKAITTEGRKLIESGLKDPIIYKVIIATSAKADLPGIADNYIRQAAAIWPDLEAVLEEVKSKRSI